MKVEGGPYRQSPESAGSLQASQRNARTRSRMLSSLAVATSMLNGRMLDAGELSDLVMPFLGPASIYLLRSSGNRRQTRIAKDSGVPNRMEETKTGFSIMSRWASGQCCQDYRRTQALINAFEGKSSLASASTGSVLAGLVKTMRLSIPNCATRTLRVSLEREPHLDAPRVRKRVTRSEQPAKLKHPIPQRRSFPFRYLQAPPRKPCVAVNCWRDLAGPGV